MHNGQEVQKKAVLEFIEQKHERVYGTITMDGVRNIKWKVEGDYNGRFLRLLWHPDSKASNRFVVDLGCYFYEQQGDGSFAGYGVGFESEINRIEVGKDILRQLS